jgi:uncharacterized protein (TIGR03435 family)
MDASHPFNPRHFGPHINSAGASYWTMTVGSLLAYAYGGEFFQVRGPEWTTAEHYDIDARFPEGASKDDERRMLKTLLKDRFKLAFHVEKGELDGYAVVVGKHGEKLRPSVPDPATPKADTASTSGVNNGGDGNAKTEITKNADGSSTFNMGKRGTQTVKFDQENWAQHWEFSKMTMEELAIRLSVCMDRSYHKVVDETGIKGTYQIGYDCPLPIPRPQSGAGAAGVLPADPEDGGVLTRSLDAMGLKLEKRKMPMDFYVIDHVEKPSDN